LGDSPERQCRVNIGETRGLPSWLSKEIFGSGVVLKKEKVGGDEKTLWPYIPFTVTSCT